MVSIVKEVPDFKFEIGDKVKKIKGYTFIGKVVSRYTVDGGNRYDVQVDTLEARQYVLGELYHTTKMTKIQRAKLYEYVNNCNGMIHIFSEEQLEKY